MLFPTRLAWLLFLLAAGWLAACGDRTDVLLTGFDAGSSVDARPRTDSPFCNPAHPCDAHACSPATCEGCCTTTGECVGGDVDDDCGTGGQACSVCSSAQVCNGSHVCIGPASCGPATCGGCCDPAGHCQPGTSFTLCGTGGMACESCAQPGFTTCNTSTQTCQGVTTDCNGETCPAGCCEPNGGGGLQCVGGSSDASCGTAGQACQDCAGQGETCNASSFTCVAPTGCGPESCVGGCCEGNQCIVGGPPTACGLGGVPCGACAPGQFCSDGTCQEPDGGQPCGPENCAGCCGAAGNCRAGTRNTTCGTGGEECQDCEPDGTCSNGFCVFVSPPPCGPDCAGCCDATGTCQPGSTPFQCGAGGMTCRPCEAEGEKCLGGTCVGFGSCSPATCPNGCCQNGQCQTAETVNACGTGGTGCAACPSGDACVGGVCVGSTCAENCPTGCCDDHDVCQPGTTSQACGEGGQCAVCGGGGFCEEGQCFNATCSPANCPTGCCDENNACQPGDQTFDCGTGGTFCNQCDATSQCIGGNCQETNCNEETCNGCCDQGDNCQAGTTNTLCGSFGDECNVCPTGSVCSDGVCTGFGCNATTCPGGCCDSNNNCQTGVGGTGGVTCPCSATCEGCCDASGDCRAGTIDAACGSGGETCVDCVSMKQTCDTDQFPVICDQSCPSPYPGCPTGTTVTPPQFFPNACHAGDFQDAAAACAAGAETAECQNFFDGEDEANFNCAECLQQFDYDFVDLTGIYTCAEPFVNAACETWLSCANDCATTVCESCVGDQTACLNTAISGECGTYVGDANKCISGLPPANTLCSQNSYPNFGAWLQGVGEHYCGAVMLPP